MKTAEAQSKISNLVQSKYDHLVTADGMVHRSLFTDPAIFEDEMKQIFGGTWVFLLHESEIPQVNDFKCVNIGRRPLIVSRSSDGVIRGMMNRCTHRGATICPYEQGNAKRFSCPYHGWTFGNNGDLIGVTFPKGYRKGFDKAAHNLGKLPCVDSYRGYVFGSLNADVEPLEAWLGASREMIDWSVDNLATDKARVVKSGSMVFNANWKLQSDNNGDMYHVPATHKSVATMTQLRHGSGKALDHFDGDDSEMYVKYYGNGHKLIDQTPAIDSAWDRARPVPGRETYSRALEERLGEVEARKYLELTGRAGINLVLFPNMIIAGAGSFNVYEPVSVNQTIVHSYDVVLDDAPDEVNALKSRFKEDFSGFGYRDDNEIFERIQHALTTIPEMEWLDFSKGLGTDREIFEENGVVKGAVSDETGIRGTYNFWKEIMSRDVVPRVVQK